MSGHVANKECGSLGWLDARAPKAALRRRAATVLAALACVALVSFAAPAPAQTQTTLVNNSASRSATDVLTVGDLSATNILVQAQRFETGPRPVGYPLTSVKFRVGDIDSNASPRVSIYSLGSNSNPGTELYVLSGTISEGETTLTPPANTILAANTDYFVYFEDTKTTEPRGTYAISLVRDSQTDSGLSGWYLGFRRSNSGDGNWSIDFSRTTVAIELQGSVVTNAPVFSDATLTRSIAENTPANMNIGDVIPAAADADNDILAYSLEGTDAASFAFDAATRQIKTLEALDHEGKSSYSVTVKADDGYGGTDTVDVTITVTDERERAPQLARPTVVATPGSFTSLDVSWTVPNTDGRPPITDYDVQWRSRSDDTWRNGPQNVTGTSVRITGRRADREYRVRVRATNDERPGPWSNASPFVFTNRHYPRVLVPIEVPADWPLKPAALGAGDKFRLLFVTREKRALGNFEYILVNSTVLNEARNGHSAIQPHVLSFGTMACSYQSSAIDNTATPTSDSSVSVYWLNGEKVADNYADLYDGSWDSNQPKYPDGTDAPRSGRDGRVTHGCQTSGRSHDDHYIGALKVMAGQPGVSGSELAGRELSRDFPLRFYGMSGIFQVVAPTNNAPEFSDATLTRSIAENTPADVNIGDVIPAATDADTDDLTYSMEGTDEASFNFDVSSRQISTKADVTYDFEAKSSYSVTVKVEDGNGGTDTVDVTISVTDVDEPPNAPTALTATFEGVPREYDPGDAFTFELHLSEDIEGLSYRTVRKALWVRNGRVRRAQRLTTGSNQDWRVTVQPTRTGDITIVLPARACGESLAVCTADGRALSEQVVVAVRSTRFMAWLSASPSEHDGETPFTLMLGLNVQPQGLSYRTVRDGLFDVSGGQVTGARRTRQDSGRLWLVTLAPTSTADMSLTVRGTDSCEAAHAVCTEDGRRLRRGPSVTISGPPGVSVADARVQEAAGATLAFTVSLSRADADTVTVNYATSDGTATAGADYTAASGTLTFTPGELTKTVSMAVLDDGYDEDEETMTLTLSNVSGAYLLDGEATGTIENSDPLQRAWLSRFGRTAATHVVDAVSDRLRGPRHAPSQVTIGGYRLPLGQSRGRAAGPATSPPGSDAEASTSALLPGVAGVLGLGLAGPGAPADGEPGSDPRLGQSQTLGLPDVRLRDVLLGSSFRLTLNAAHAGGGPRLTAWGRVAGTQFDGKDGELTLDGDVFTGTVGVDGEWDQVLAGVAVAHSRGEGSFAIPGTAAQGRGELEQTLTSLHPYLRYAVTDRLDVWGLLGYGWGQMELEPGAGATLETDTRLIMGAFGGRGILLAAAERGGFEIATRTDAMLTRTSSDAVTGATGNLAAADAEAHRLRVVLEGSRGFALSAGRSLAPSVEVGLRHDWGDAETGFGLEVGGRVRYADPGLGLTIEGAVRALLAHEDSDYKEWGASGTVRLAPGPAGQGLALTLSPTWGVASSGVDGLWSRQTTAGLAQTSQVQPATRLNAEVGYGVVVFDKGLLTPYAGTVLTDGAARTYRLGTRWTSLSGLALTLEGTRQEPAGPQPVNQGLQLQVGWGF